MSIKLKKLIKGGYIYKLRYFIPFILFAPILYFTVFYSFSSLPYGVSQGELQSAISSAGLSITNIFTNFSSSTTSLVNIPWHLVQNTIINAFSFEVFYFRLPSIVFAIATVIALSTMFYIVFSYSVATIGTLALSSSVVLASLARSGDYPIFTVFLVSVILLLVTILLRFPRPKTLKDKSLKITLMILLVVICSLLAYMKYGIYLLVTLYIAGIIHPRTRLILLRRKLYRKLIYLLLSLLLVAPIIAALAIELTHGKTDILYGLLLPKSINLLANASTIVKSLFVLAPDNSYGLVLPIINYVTLLMILIGLFSSIKHIFSSRSYLAMSLLIACLVLSLIDISQLYLLFIPLIILFVIGFDLLINYWLALFPLNPYPKVVIAVSIFCIVIASSVFDINRYFDTIFYTKVAYANDMTFTGVSNFVTRNKTDKTFIVIKRSDIDKYIRLTKDNKNVNLLLYSDLDYAFRDATQFTNIIMLTNDPIENFNGYKVKPRRFITTRLSNKPKLFNIYSFN